MQAARTLLLGVCALIYAVTASGAALANCYVLRNANAHGNLNLSFQYSAPIGEGPVSAMVLPGQQYPLGGGQWCINGGSVTILFSGPGHLRGPSGQLWRGGLVFGVGGPLAAPSGTYTIGPP
jgi:hypothetical protein